MPFDSKRFLSTTFAPRTADVAVPGLADWFGDGEPAVWTVRGQTANEVAVSIDAGNKQRNIDSIVKAIAANSDQVEELRRAIGVSKDTHADIVKRLEMLTQCSVEPSITLDVAVKLAEARPIEFYALTNKILHLTGEGMDVKKLPPSGAATTSEA
jgi:hypothetical protein